MPFSNEAITVLRNLSSEIDDVARYSTDICDDIGVDKDVFLSHCRKFRDEGYAKIVLLVDVDEGTPNGSAYVRTEKGNCLLALALGPGWRRAA